MTNRNIMVVDDEPLINESFGEAFTEAGYTVFTASSAEEALEIIKKNRLLVFFLDLNLPGMNGVDLCRAIRKESPMAICHAVTGYATLFELVECREAGFEDYFIKPVRTQALIDAAAHAFRKLERWCKW